MSIGHTTIKDIARKLNISPSTVFRALRNHSDISPETKKKVSSLAEELDYHPNLIAKSLQKRKTNTIGIIVPEIRHDFFQALLVALKMSAIGLITPLWSVSLMKVQKKKTKLSRHWCLTALMV